MIPSAFQISLVGDGGGPVPIKITIGPGIIFICLMFAIVLLVKSRLK